MSRGRGGGGGQREGQGQRPWSANRPGVFGRPVWLGEEMSSERRGEALWGKGPLHPFSSLLFPPLVYSG